LHIVHPQRQSPEGGLTSLVRQAGLGDLDRIVPLFDAYRQFYQQPSDPDLARGFLRDRLRNHESVIFLALDPDGKALGFTQIYPSFSSGAARRIYILNDLFVIPEARRRKVGKALLEAAAEFGRKNSAVRLTLSTALANSPAQSLYERTGWKRDQIFCVYNLPL
jgi:GNAT superfamily N-acetyltransferase